MDMNFDFDERVSRRGKGSFKWDDNQRLFGRPDLLPFWVADMDFRTPQPILDAIAERCKHPVLGYEIRLQEYYDVITDWLAERHDWQVPKEWLMFCPPSSIVGIYGLIAELTNPGDTILAPTPTYGPLISLIVANGRTIIRSPLSEDQEGRFHLDIEDLAARLAPETRLVLMCSPNNPVGRVFEQAELDALAALAEAENLIVVSDEVHADLVMPGHRHIPYGKVGGKRSVTVISPNKTFNTAGIPQTTLIIPDADLRAKFQRYLNRMQLNHDNTFGAVGMLAGYRHCGAWLEAVKQYIFANHTLAEEFLQTELSGVRKVRAEGTYLAWLDFRGAGISQDELMQRLVHKGGVGLYSGTDFGEEGRGFFRMNLACPRALLLEGLNGIAKAMRD